MENKKIQKSDNYNSLSKLEKNIQNINKYLPQQKSEKELWDWWNGLDDLWKDIFVINYMFERDFDKVENLISISNFVEGIYKTFYTRYSYFFKNNLINVDTKILKKFLKLKF